MSTDTTSNDRLIIGIRIVASVVLVLGIAELGLGVYAWVDSSRATGDAAEFAGLGYLLALVVGVPGLLAVILGGASLAVGRHPTPACAAAAAGTLAALGPILVFVAFHF